MVAAIATIEPGIEVGKAKIERLTAQTIELEATLGEADKVEQRLATARAGLPQVDHRVSTDVDPDRVVKQDPRLPDSGGRPNF